MCSQYFAFAYPSIYSINIGRKIQDWRVSGVLHLLHPAGGERERGRLHSQEASRQIGTYL